MVNLQSEFLEFHEKIKLSYDDNEELRQKRDILLEKLRNNIDKEAPSFSSFSQGSYAMHTGVKPDDGDYDIDVGLRFDLNRSDYPDPVEVKNWVYPPAGVSCTPRPLHQERHRTPLQCSRRCRSEYRSRRPGTEPCG